MPDPNVSVSADGQSSTYTYSGRKSLDLDTQLDAALGRCNGDPVAASHLFLRWAESNSEIAALIPDVLTDYITRRMKQRAKETARK